VICYCARQINHNSNAFCFINHCIIIVDGALLIKLMKFRWNCRTDFHKPIVLCQCIIMWVCSERVGLQRHPMAKSMKCFYAENKLIISGYKCSFLL